MPGPYHPKFPSGMGGAQTCFILCDQTTGDLQARITLTAPSVPPPFLSAELWVIRHHLGNQGRMLSSTV